MISSIEQLNIVDNFSIVFISGNVAPFSHLDTACLVTYNLLAISCWVKSFFFLNFFILSLIYYVIDLMKVVVYTYYIEL
jgi:hypothetical protein